MKTAIRKTGLLSPLSARLALFASICVLACAGSANAIPMPTPPGSPVADTPSTPANVASPAMIPPPVLAPALTPVAPANDAALLKPATTADADIPAIIPGTGADKDQKANKGLASAEDKISDSAKNLAKHMSVTDSITLDDLNSARQAIAKIDALIDIEKRLAELEKVRGEREGGGSTKAIAAMPASALTPLPSPPQPNMIPLTPMQGMGGVPAAGIPMAISGNNIEITRILGGAGRYSALIKVADGTNKMVEAGDRLPEGEGKVIAITPSGVELEQNGKQRTVPVKNVSMVFSNSP